MGTPRHPLKPLHELREEEAEAAARALSEARRQEERARHDEAAALAALEELRVAHEAIRTQEQVALGRGSLRVADLLTASHWEAGARLAAEHATDAATAATDRVREHESNTAERLRATATAQANADAVERLLERAAAAKRAKAEAATEEAAEEANLARRARAPRG